MLELVLNFPATGKLNLNVNKKNSPRSRSNHFASCPSCRFIATDKNLKSDLVDLVDLFFFGKLLREMFLSNLYYTPATFRKTSNFTDKEFVRLGVFSLYMETDM